MKNANGLTIPNDPPTVDNPVVQTKGDDEPALTAGEGDEPGMLDGLSKMEQMKWKRENMAAQAEAETVWQIQSS